MRLCVQLVRASDGVRTEAFEVDRDELAVRLYKDSKLFDGVSADDLVLVLAEMREDNWMLSTAPMVYVRSYLLTYHPDRPEV